MKPVHSSYVVIAILPLLIATPFNGVPAASAQECLHSKDDFPWTGEGTLYRDNIGVGGSQRKSNDSFASEVEEGQASTGRLISTGLLWGGGGFIVGYTLGAVLTPDTNPEGSDPLGSDKVDNGIICGSVAGAVTLPLGIHHGNRHQGDMKWVLLASVGMGAAGWGLTLATENAIWVPVTVLAQFAACIVVEKKTAGGSVPREQRKASMLRSPRGSGGHRTDREDKRALADEILGIEEEG